MHFVCCIKQVPDTADVKIDPETNTLIRAGVEAISNPYDIVALAEAIRLKEKYGGRVTVISMGPPQAESSLREAVALGADEAILLSDRAFAGADTLATSYTLARAIETLSRDVPVDLVFCGKQAIDGDTAQTGPGIATRLGFTQFTYVVEIEWLDPSSRQIQVRRKVEGGIEAIRGSLPVLLTTELELARPGRAPLPSIIYSLKMPIKTWNARAIDAHAQKVGIKGSPTWVKAISSPPVRAGGPKFEVASGLEQAVGRLLDFLLSDETFSTKFLKRWEV